MWVIIERSKNKPEHCWISGVFINHDDAQEYLSTLPSRPAEIQELREIAAQEYPVMFVHDFDIHDCLYVTLDELTDKLLAFDKVEDEDHEYCKYYIFQKDYRGFSAEEKYYAWANHQHVDNQKMSHLIRTGLNIDSLGGISGIYCCANCNRKMTGVLSETGYGPPPQWQIIPHIDPEDALMFLTVCSEDCKLKCIKEWAEEANE
ncbi:MAG: hypothetical protein CK425_04025 [Parachlamydia sp.]|nr:MAG: hypothetical protein CK425_04025 [Parachlamydia sp.]